MQQKTFKTNNSARFLDMRVHISSFCTNLVIFCIVTLLPSTWDEKYVRLFWPECQPYIALFANIHKINRLGADSVTRLKVYITQIKYRKKPNLQAVRRPFPMQLH